MTTAACTLDDEARRAQLARYRALGPSVTSIFQTRRAILVRFDETLDHEALDQTLALERRCCPFLDLTADHAMRALRAHARAPEHRPALDAIAAAFEVGRVRRG